MERIAIIGYSGHAYVVLDACKKAGIKVQYYCEKNKVQSNPFQLEYAGDEGSKDFNWKNIDAVVLGVGDNKIRQKAADTINSKGKIIKTVVHPTAIVNDFVSIGKGTMLSSNVVINPLAEIGDNCILNTGVIIEHECKIGNACHIAPGAVLAGNVIIGNNCFVGANAVIKQGIKIGNNVTIGAGSVVINDIPDNEIWAGNPAKLISKK